MSMIGLLVVTGVHSERWGWVDGRTLGYLVSCGGVEFGDFLDFLVGDGFRGHPAYERRRVGCETGLQREQCWLGDGAAWAGEGAEGTCAGSVELAHEGANDEGA